MANKQSDFEDETTVVRILSAVFMTLMILIINAYSDIPEPGTSLAEQNQVIGEQSLKQAHKTTQSNIIKASIRTEM